MRPRTSLGTTALLASGLSLLSGVPQVRTANRSGLAKPPKKISGPRYSEPGGAAAARRRRQIKAGQLKAENGLDTSHD